jgi:hypothetical protein
MSLSPDVVRALRGPKDENDKILLTNALARASWLNDPFTTDIGYGAKASPLTVAQVDKCAKDELADLDVGERTLYLVNPFLEGIRRLDAYFQLLDQIAARQADAARNPRYVLAKRIEAVIKKDESRKELVNSSLLDGELGQVEGPIATLLFRAEECAADLLRWCCYPYSPSGWTWFTGKLDLKKYTFDLAPSGNATEYKDELRPEQKVASNWFSAAMYEGDCGTKEWKGFVAKLRSDVNAHLAITKHGQEFLGKQAERCLGEADIKPGSDDGLLGDSCES